MPTITTLKTPPTSVEGVPTDLADFHDDYDWCMVNGKIWYDYNDIPFANTGAILNDEHLDGYSVEYKEDPRSGYMNAMFYTRFEFKGNVKELLNNFYNNFLKTEEERKYVSAILDEDRANETLYENLYDGVILDWTEVMEEVSNDVTDAHLPSKLEVILKRVALDHVPSFKF